MKTKFINGLTILFFVFAACNNNEKKNEHQGPEMNKDPTQLATTPDDKQIKEVAVTYTNVDVKAAVSIKEIIGHYLHVKNALASDNASEAASGAKAIGKAMSGLDKSLLSADQKKLYDGIEEDLKEHAEHIGKNGDNIKHQREHFLMMSNDVYDLVKAFGGGQILYHDHCPMYNEDKGGAMWLSETKEVKNPYFGSEMPKCGSVEEIIK